MKECNNNSNSILVNRIGLKNMKHKINNLKVALVQTNLIWEDPEANRNLFEQKMKDLPETDLVILPEMFTTGFSMNASGMAESMEGPTVKWMVRQAIRYNAAICGSLILKARENYYNRLIWAQPDGKLLWYDKRHLFRMGKEDLVFSPGKNRLVVHWRGWRICPLICYDLRFPVFSRNQNDYELLLYVANWPDSRRQVWRTLLAARAIENQVYCIGVNRIGEDGAGLHYTGDSLCFNPKGTILKDGQENDSVLSTTLDLQALNRFREKFPVGMDGDAFNLME